MTPDFIIFDLDGTLVDSAPDLHLSANLMLSELGRPEQSLATVTGFVGNGVARLVERCLLATGGLGETTVKEALAVFNRHYLSNLTTLTRPYPGVTAQLKRLKREGVKMAICTNKPQALARGVCDGLGLSRFFVEITGATDNSPRKPDPHMLLATIDAIGSDSDRGWFVGDSIVDQETAANASVDFAFFSGGYLNSPMAEIVTTQVFSDWNEFGPEFGSKSGV